ncbi:MAG: 2-oxoacid:acceptor oxidoreductase family protein [Desulfobacterales bacterium]
MQDNRYRTTCQLEEVIGAMNDKTAESEKKEVIITGFGGQGIVLAGSILGKAAALGDHLESTLVQSYGPESRGGACSAQVVISTGTIHYPYIKTPDVLVCMSQSAYEKYVDSLKPEGILLLDQDLVRPKGKKKDFFSIPATRMAEELGRTMMANIIMIGFLTAITRIVSTDAARSSIMESVPKGTEEMNTKAFEKGFDYGLAILKGRQKKAAGQVGAIS